MHERADLAHQIKVHVDVPEFRIETISETMMVWSQRFRSDLKIG